MAWDPTPSQWINATSGIILVVGGIVLWLQARGLKRVGAFGLFLAWFGAYFVLANLGTNVRGLHASTHDVLEYAAGVPTLLAAFFLWRAAPWVPGPHRTRLRGVTAAVAIAWLVTLVAVATINQLEPTPSYTLTTADDVSPQSLADWVFTYSWTALAAALGFAQLHWLVAGRRDTSAAGPALISIALGAYLFVGTGLSLTGLAQNLDRLGLGPVLENAARLAFHVGLAFAWLLSGHRHGRAVAMWSLGFILVGMVLALGPQFRGYVGISRIFAFTILAYAVLRKHVLGADLAMKWTLRRGTFAALVILVFFGVTEAAERLFSVRYGEGVGIAAAALLSLGIAPLQRAIDKAAERALPGVGGEAYREEHAVELFRSAVEMALADDAVSRREKAYLERLGGRLGLSTDEVAAAFDAQTTS